MKDISGFLLLVHRKIRKKLQGDWLNCFRSKGSILSQSYRQIQNMIQLYCHKSSKQCKPVQVLQISKQCKGIYLALAAQICLLGNIPNPSNSSKYILKKLRLRLINCQCFVDILSTFCQWRYVSKCDKVYVTEIIKISKQYV